MVVKSLILDRINQPSYIINHGFKPFPKCIVARNKIISSVCPSVNNHNTLDMLCLNGETS